MTNVNEILNAIERALKQSGKLSEIESWATEEFDTDGEDANLPVPAVEIQPIMANRSQSTNTDLVDYVEDDQGNRIGRILDVYFDFEVDVDIWTAAGNDATDATELGSQLENALYRYDSQVGQRLLPDGSGNVLNEVTRFVVSEGERADRLTVTPSVRRWRTTIDMDFYNRINTVEEFGPDPTIKGVRTPKDGDFFGGTEDDIEIEGRPAHFDNP